MKKRLQNLRGEAGQRGVAMVTVILMGAALSSMATVAAYSTIRELRTGSDDRKATEALGYAEAGVDRLMQHLRSGTVTWGHLRQAGCPTPLSIAQGGVGNGTFTAQLSVFDPNAIDPADRYAPAACSAVPLSPRTGGFFVITSTGSHPDAKRVVQQVVRIAPIGLPIGMSAQYVDANGTPDIPGLSLVTTGRVFGRSKLDFTGSDPYYKVEDFYPQGASGLAPTDAVPAAAHAVGGLYLRNNGGAEFATATKNCAANKTATNSQSLWDGDGTSGSGTITSGCAGQTGFPPTSKFTQADFDRVAPKRLDDFDHQGLKTAAQDYGIYCSITGATYSCTRQGESIGSGWSAGITSLMASGTNNFVTYFEFQGGDPLSQNVNWGPEVWGCSDDLSQLRSAVVIVRNGGFNMSSGNRLNGAVIADGNFDYTGTPSINGTIIAHDFRIRGTANFSLDPCWVRNMPGPFLGTTPVSWREIDR